MVKLLFVSNQLTGGGAERVITLLANKFAEENYEVRFCVYKKRDESYKVAKNINVEYLFSNKEQVSKVEKIIRLRKTIKKYKPDTIISFEYFVNMQTIIANFGLKNRVIVSERNDPKQVGGKFPNNVIRNLLYRFCDTLVCQTQDALEYFPKYVQRKSVIIANPVHQDLPKPWIGERERTIINFCRLEKQKNLKLLIDSFENFLQVYPDYKLKIYGNGKEKNSLLNYIEEKNLTKKIEIYNAIPDIHTKALKCAMFVSSSDYEGLSNSMLEAMAIGLPTICTDCPCGGARMIIDDHVNGLLVPVGDVNKLCEAMLSVANDKDLSIKLSNNGAKIKDELSREKIIKKWSAVI